MHAYYVGDNDLKINNQFFKTYMLTRGCYHTFLLFSLVYKDFIQNIEYDWTTVI